MTATRRRFLATIGAAGSLSGCISDVRTALAGGPLTGTIVNDDEQRHPRRNNELPEPTTEWPSYQYDERNHGFNPAVREGPGQNARVQWIYEAGSDRNTLIGPPALHDRTIFVATESAVSAIDAITGTDLWTTPIEERVETSVAVTEESVFVGTGQSILCIDRSGRTVTWRGSLHDRPDWDEYQNIKASGPPAVNDGRVFIGGVNGHFYAFDARTGDRLWRRTADGLPHDEEPPSSANVPVFASPPAITSDTVIVGNWSGDVYAFDVETGETEWQNTILSRNLQPAPTLVGDTVYASSQVEIVGLSVEDGSVQWRFSEEPGSTNHSMVYADDTMYLPSGPAYESLSFVALHPAERSIEWRVPGRSHWSASAGPEFLYVPMYDGLIAIDRETGDIAWEMIAPDEIIGGPPIVTDGAVITADEWGNVYGIGSDD